MSAVRIGSLAEDAAVNFLQQHQLLVLKRNFRCKHGEIDLIAKDNDFLVFIEVRYRKNAAYGSAAESIDNRKQLKIQNAAQFFMQKHSWAQKVQCRFDVIVMSKDIAAPNIEWIKDAFNEEIY